MFVVTLPSDRSRDAEAFSREAAQAGADVLEVRGDLTPEPILESSALPLLFAPRGVTSSWAREQHLAWLDLESDEASSLTAERRIASFHDYEGTPHRDELVRIGRELRGDGVDLVKIATRVTHPDELVTLAEVRQALGENGLVTVHAMGELAEMDRVLSPWTNALTYSFLEGESASAPGQLSLEAYRRLSGPNPPRLFGILGGPGLVTASPVIHHTLQDRHGVRGHFLRLPAADGSAAFAAAKSLGVEGLAVTAPHKRTIVREVDVLDGVAAALSSVNTCVDVDGRWHGFQLDVVGLVRGYPWLADMRSAAVVGSGGVVPAVLRALADHGVEDVTVHARDAERRRELASTFRVAEAGLEALPEARADVVVWALSVDREDLELPHDAGGKLLDLRYGAAATLGERAHACGRTYVDGRAMLVEQALAQFERFTGLECKGEDRAAVDAIFPAP